MVLFIHLCAALASLGWATYSYITPSATKLKIAYGLVGLTLGSGTYLVVSTHSKILSACLSGLLYLAVTFGFLTAAQKKLNN